LTKYKFLLIDDEVSGLQGFAIEQCSVEPDIICCAKALVSVLPLGVTIAKARIIDWTAGSHASTFGGNPLSCVAASAILDVVKDQQLLDNANKQGAYAIKRLEELKENCEIVGDVRGKGLMIGVELVESKETKVPASKKASEVILLSWKRGVVVVTCGASMLRIAPPLTIQSDMLGIALDIIEIQLMRWQKKT
jgi:4-aminobutyrate aminotransferase